MDNINVFQQYPNCVSDRVKFRGILFDCFPTQKAKVNLILNAYDEGIMRDIESASLLDIYFFSRWKKRVIDSYGISEENAEWTINYWCTQYGVTICHKPYKLDVSNSNNNVISSSTPTTESDMVVNLSKLEEDEKLSKRLMIYDTFSNRNVHISKFICSARKGTVFGNGETSIIFTGEYTGTFEDNTYILIMVYNANGNLIAYDGDASIDKNFKGTAAFCQSFEVPSDEYISKIRIKLVSDTFWI